MQELASNSAIAAYQDDSSQQAVISDETSYKTPNTRKTSCWICVPVDTF